MALELVDYRADARSWTPFPSSTDYEHPHWWENAGGAVGDPWFVQVLDHGVEVARVQLDERGGINSSYPVAPAALGANCWRFNSSRWPLTPAGARSQHVPCRPSLSGTPTGS